jgi:general secretion pathway protein K
MIGRSRRQHRSASFSRERGVALIMVLWITVMLTVIGASFAYAMRNEALAARNTVSWAQARALADGAVYRTVFELLRPKVSPDVWAADGRSHAWDQDGAHIVVDAIDESGKIDINGASDALLRGLLKTAGGLDDAAASQLVDAIGDWKDADDLRRPNGAEAADYKAAGSPYVPANAPFETLPELQRVLGMTPALYAAIADSLTVNSRQPGINPVYASRAILLAVPGATADVVDTYIAQRALALATKLPPPPFPVTGAMAGAINLWRIHAEVTMDDGVKFVRDAVIRPGDQRRLLTVMEWQDGTSRTSIIAPGEQDSANSTAATTSPTSTSGVAMSPRSTMGNTMSSPSNTTSSPSNTTSSPSNTVSSPSYGTRTR